MQFPFLKIGFKQRTFGGGDKGGGGKGREDGPSTVTRGSAYNNASNKNRDKGDTGPTQEARDAQAARQAKSAADNRFFSTDQNDGKYGYTRTDGTKVSPTQDRINGGGPDYGGAAFGSGGGAELDLNNDRYISEAELSAGRTPENPNGLQQNLWSGISTAIGATPLGSGLPPTGFAKFIDNAPFGLGLVNAARTASPPSYIRPDSSLPAQSDPAYANLDMWWDGDQYQPSTTATNTGLAPRTTAAESILNNNNDGTGGGTSPADSATSGGPGRAPAPEGYMYDVNGVLIPIPVQSGQPINSNLSYQPGQTTVATLNNYANPFTPALPVSQSDAFMPPSLAQIQGAPSPYAQQQTAFEQMQQPPVLFPNSLV